MAQKMTCQPCSNRCSRNRWYCISPDTRMATRPRQNAYSAKKSTTKVAVRMKLARSREIEGMRTELRGLYPPLLPIRFHYSLYVHRSHSRPCCHSERHSARPHPTRIQESRRCPERSPEPSGGEGKWESHLTLSSTRPRATTQVQPFKSLQLFPASSYLAR